MANERSQHLSVDKRIGHHAERVLEHFQIFAARVEKLGDVLILQQRLKRCPVGDGQRIDKRDVFAVIQLDKPQLWVVSTGTDKFGVQRQGALRACGLAQRRQRVIGGNHLVIQIALSLSAPIKNAGRTGVRAT